MGDQNECRARLGVQLKHHPGDPVRRLPVQVSSGFIGKQNLRFIDERTGHRHALLFAATQLRRVMIQSVCQTHPVEQF